jgi:aryl-alcohol dehydrogenase-like predicted oxidoreductase
MQTRQLGTSSIQITPILMGTWQAGKRGWVGVEDDQVIAAMRAAFDAGVTTFDTAEIYGNGYSEELVGKALSDIRDRVIYATKVFPTHLKYQEILDACENSLRRLQTDYIDLYQIHWPAGNFNSDIVPISESMRAMVKLKEDGKIGAIGVSNFSRAQLEEAAQYGPIDSLQPPYSLFWRHVETDAMPYCVEHNITILAYSPMAQGLLTGKFGPDHTFEDGDVRASNKLFQPGNYDRAQAALDRLRPIADKYKITLAQLSLAWLMGQPQTCVIAGARNAEQASQNAIAAAVQLDERDRAEMDAIGHSVFDHLEDDNPVMWSFAS